MSARLLFRVDPIEGESPRGYLCRVAHDHRYCGPFSLAQIAGLQASGLDCEDSIKQLSYALRLKPEEWHSMCYHHVKARNGIKQRSFCGEWVSADDLNYGRPRLCPGCLRERPIWWAVWDLGLLVACPRHRCLLINQCPACKGRVARQRPAVHKCRCGLDFRDLALDPADTDLVAINTAIYRAAGFPPGAMAELGLANCSFPGELLKLRLGSLLRLVLFMGSIKDNDKLRRKQRYFGATDLAAAIEIGRAAAAMLRDWPHPLRAVLKRMLPTESNDPAALSFSEIFGNFYRHLFRVLPRNEFGFLHQAFERFVIEDWTGLIRGQHRYFSAVVQRSSHWVTANEAERVARIAGGRILDLVREGQLETIFLKSRGGGNRTEYWIRRESLHRWISNRDLELARYMPRLEAQRTLGLKNVTVTAVAQAGLIRYAKGTECYFPTGFHFLREDVIRIKNAFEKHAVLEREYSKPGTLIALRHALKNYLGRDIGLPAVIRAVVDGDLAPVAYTHRFPGITGYLFSFEQLRRYRPVSGISVPPEGFLTYGEAGALLGVKTAVIRGLVACGILNARELRNGLAKLVPAGDVQRFAQQHVAAPVLAKLLKLDFRSLHPFLRRAGIPVLSIPVIGKGHTVFVRKEVAISALIPCESRCG